MKIMAINEKTGFSREYSSVEELKRYLKNRPFMLSYILKSWCLFRILPDGSKLPMRFGIRNMYDFVDHYRI
jgi:hypothetical protein